MPHSVNRGPSACSIFTRIHNEKKIGVRCGWCALTMAAMDRKMLLYMIAVCCVWQWRGMSAIGISVAGASDSGK